jgi:hypothetical protein
MSCLCSVAPNKFCELQGEADCHPSFWKLWLLILPGHCFFWLSSLQFVRLSKLQWAHQQVSVSTVVLYQQPAVGTVVLYQEVCVSTVVLYQQLIVSTVVLYQQTGASTVVLYQPSCVSNIVSSVQHKRLSPNCKKKGFQPLPWILDWSRLLKDTNTCYVQMYCSLVNG